MWEIWIVVVLIVLVALVATALMRPSYILDRNMMVNACIGNLRLIDGAKAQWAVEHDKHSTDIPTASDLQPYMGRGSDGELPCCPNDPKQRFDTSYAANNVGSKPVCRILPTNHILP